MSLQPPDYVILAMTAGGAVTGLFIGFSGALAFFAGCAAAVCSVHFGWPFSAMLFDSGIVRAASVALAALVAFWVARSLIGRTVKLAVAQPGDSLLGAIAAGASGAAVGIGLVWLAQFFGLAGASESAIMEEVLGHVG